MIRNVKIKNFKSIEYADINLPRFSAMIGKNGSGKTNFISAIYLLKKLTMGMDFTDAKSNISFFMNDFFYTGKARNNEAEFEFKIETPSKAIYIFKYTVARKTTIVNKLMRNSISIEKESLEQFIDGGENMLVYRRENGEEGSVFDGKQKNIIPSCKVKALDTNGAGDLFAGAFLFGLSRGKDLVTSSKLACRASSHLVTKLGARLAKEEAVKIRKEILGE